MALTEIAGYGGAFAGPGGTTSGINLVSINEWSATLENDTVPIPPSFGEIWEGAEITIQRMTGTCKGRLTYMYPSSQPFFPASSCTTGLSAYMGTATLTMADGCFITGTFSFQTIGMTRPHAGVAEITATFRNAESDVAITWAEA